MEHAACLRLTYPIAYGNKYVTVGLFQQQDYDVCVTFNNQRRTVLLDAADWNLLMLLRDRITCGIKQQQQQQSKDAKFMFMCDDKQDNEKLKSAIIKNSGHVQIKTNKNKSITFSEKEWYNFVNISTVLCKYFNRLFHQQHEYKTYINAVLATGQFVFTHEANYDYGRLYNELVMKGQLSIGGVTPEVVNMEDTIVNKC